MKCDFDGNLITGNPVTISTTDVKDNVSVIFTFCCKECEQKYIKEHFQILQTSIGNFLYQTEKSKIDFNKIIEENK